MFYRAVKMSGTVYYRAFTDLMFEHGDVQELLGAGDIVVLADDLEEIAEIFGVLMRDLVNIDEVEADDE